MLICSRFLSVMFDKMAGPYHRAVFLKFMYRPFINILQEPRELIQASQI